MEVECSRVEAIGAKITGTEASLFSSDLPTIEDSPRDTGLL